jgi:hypothetical protein
MWSHNIIFRLILPVILISSLSGCNSQTSLPSPPKFTPVRPDATSTPTLSAGAPMPAGTPTSVVPEQIAITNFTHPTQRFSIGYPANWQFFERPNGVIFIDPAGQAAYSVVFSDTGEAYSEEELNQYLVTFVAQNFVDKEADFSAISQEQKPDGSIVAQFASNDANLGPAINEVRVWQEDTILFTLLMSATEEQWQVSQQKLQNLAGTFIALDTQPVTEVTPTPEPPVWLLTGSNGSEFGFLYPSTWEIVQQDERLVTVAWLEGEVTFEAKVFDQPDPEDEPTTAAEKAALAYLKSVENEQQNVRSKPAEAYPLDTVTGSTIDLLFTAADGTEMASSVITGANEGKIYRIVFTSPAAIYQNALEWFNPMYQSFKILSPEDSILSEGGE